MDFLKYSQSGGGITRNNGFLAQGWSGNGAGKNNPDMQNVSCIGPLPCGSYTIGPWQETHGELGPIVAELIPDADNKMFGRSGFFIHGPAIDPKKYGQESKGCIVIPRRGRLVVKTSGLTRLVVVP